MYKSTQKNTEFFTRTGSWSIRPLRNGYIPEVPWWADEPDEYFCSLPEQHNNIVRQFLNMRDYFDMRTEELSEPNMPWEQYKAITDELNDLTPSLRRLRANLKALLEEDEPVAPEPEFHFDTAPLMQRKLEQLKAYFQ